MSDSVRHQRWQPTRLPCSWDSPGKNTGVGCHFLLQCMKVKRESEVTQSYPTLRDAMDCSLPGSSVHGIFQARVLEWVPLPSLNGSRPCLKRRHGVQGGSILPGDKLKSMQALKRKPKEIWCLRHVSVWGAWHR